MMKRLNSFCALFLLLVTSISTHAGVTDGDVTAYRYVPSTQWVLFTDDPIEDPASADAPLGAAYMGSNLCIHGAGNASVKGLVCNGTSGDPVSTYTCDLTSTPNASNTTWCLFSETPRTGGKAWAVKYVNGVIPTNDGASIVRCEGTDIFHPYSGCVAWTPPSEISIEGGFMKLDTTDGNAPHGLDCNETAHNGRMVVDEVGGKLYICTTIGWETITTDP